MAAVCQIDSAARLAFVWELVGRGADLCSIIDHDYRDMTLASPSRRICSTLTPIVPSCEIISIGSRVRTFSLAFASMEAGRRINGHLTRAFSASGLCSYAVARKRPTDASRASRTSPMGPVGGSWLFGWVRIDARVCCKNWLNMTRRTPRRHRRPILLYTTNRLIIRVGQRLVARHAPPDPARRLRSHRARAGSTRRRST